MDQKFFESKTIGLANFLQEKGGFHQWVHTICNRLPTYQFICRTRLRPAIQEVDTIWWQHNQSSLPNFSISWWSWQIQSRKFWDRTWSWQASSPAWYLCAQFPDCEDRLIPWLTDTWVYGSCRAVVHLAIFIKLTVSCSLHTRKLSKRCLSFEKPLSFRRYSRETASSGSWLPGWWSSWWATIRRNLWIS